MAKTPRPAEVLRAIRAELGLSGKAMAAAIETPFRTYQRWEGEGSRVPADALLAAQKLRDAKLKKGKA